MKKRMKQQRGIVSLVTGAGTVFVGYFAWGLLTVSHKGGSLSGAGFLFSVFTMLLYALFGHSVVVLKREDLRRQIMTISGWGSLLCLLLLCRAGGDLVLRGEYEKLWLNVLWFAAFAGSYFHAGNRMRCAAANLERYSSGVAWFLTGVRKIWSQCRWLFLLLAVTIFFLIEPDAMQFKWDGLLYYLACQQGAADSISSLAPYGHIAQTYGMLNCLGSLIAGDTATAMIGVNLLLFLCSVCAFYGMIKCMLPGKSDFVYAMMTAVYAWSPFTLGMVFYHSLDFYCQCFFVIMLYFLYRQQWITFFAVSTLFCFTKEPAVLIYGVICVSLVILDFLDQRGKAFGERIGKLLRTKQYYFMVIPGILWLVTYQILGPWRAGEGGICIDGAYVIEKLKVLYILQFNWLFSVVCAGGALFCLIRKKRSVWRCLFPILCGQFAFTVFSCVFKTVNHPRYNGASQPAIICMAIVFSSCLLRNLCGKILVGGVAVLMAVSSFCTIDPVTLYCFPKYDIGSVVMVTTDTIPLGDGMIYNRQMLWLEHALEMALEDSLAESDIVFFPSLGGSTYFFDGMAKVGAVTGDYYREQEYWSAAERRRVTAPGDQVQVFSAYQLAKEPDWNAASAEFEGRKNYCYLPCAGEKRAEEIRERFRVLEEEVYTYRGWKICRICFE